MMMRPTYLLLALALAGCQTEDAGVAAARMEQQDDAACVKLSAGKGAGAYQQCRRNLIGYRQQATAEQQAAAARRDAAADSLAAAGRAMEGLGPQNVNVTVSCAYGPGRC